MREYVVRFARSARKELESLDSHLVDRIFSRIEALSTGELPLELAIKTEGSSGCSGSNG